MATKKGFLKATSLLFLSFPSRKPSGSPEDVATCLGVWEKTFVGIDDALLWEAVGKFVRETKKLFPDDNPLAMIREIAEALAKPKQITTNSAIVQMTDEQRQQGLMRFREFQAKIKTLSKKSELSDDEFEHRRQEQLQKLAIAPGEKK